MVRGDDHVDADDDHTPPKTCDQPASNLLPKNNRNRLAGSEKTKGAKKGAGHKPKQESFDSASDDNSTDVVPKNVVVPLPTASSTKKSLRTVIRDHAVGLRQSQQSKGAADEILGSFTTPNRRAQSLRLRKDRSEKKVIDNGTGSVATLAANSVALVADALSTVTLTNAEVMDQWVRGLRGTEKGSHVGGHSGKKGSGKSKNYKEKYGRGGERRKSIHSPTMMKAMREESENTKGGRPSLGTMTAQVRDMMCIWNDLLIEF